MPSKIGKTKSKKNHESDQDENSDEYTEIYSESDSEPEVTQSGGEEDIEDVEEVDDAEEVEEEEVEEDDADDELLDNGEEEEEADEETDGEVVNDEDGDENDFSVESKICHAKNLKKDIIALDDEDSAVYANLQWTKVPNEDRITGDIMTYYELVRILGTRGQMINLGAPALIETDANISPVQTAYLELLAGLTPFIIRRPLANKKYEEWRIDELKIIHDIEEEIVVPKNFDKQAFLDMIKETIPNKK